MVVIITEQGAGRPIDSEAGFRRPIRMRTYIIKRLIEAIGVCLVISMMSFFLLFLNTDPALVLLPPEAEIDDIALFKKQMGLK